MRMAGEESIIILQAAPARVVRLTQLHPLAADRAHPVVFGTQDLDGVDQQLQHHALFLGVVDLLDTGWHLLSRAAVDQRGRIGAQAARGAN